MSKLIFLLVGVLAFPLFASPGFAKPAAPVLVEGQAYADIKVGLMNQHWTPVKNVRISSSSLYAQDIYKQGYTEVVDCISMELDACWFRYKKGNQILEVKTITQQMKVDSYKLLKP